jgi:hypothetical protein
VYVAPVGVLRGYLLDSPYSASAALKRSVSLAGVEAPYLLSAYRKPVYLYFTSIDGLASSASTSAVRRYAVSEYGDVYSQYTASNRAFKIEVVERPADWFFRVSPVRRFYEYGRLYDGLSYSKSISPLLAVQLTVYRPKIRYASYSVSDYYNTYDSIGYVRSVSPMLLLQVSVYRPKLRYASFSASELYAPFESTEVKTPPVYGAGSYEVLYEPVYRPAVRYYNVYFVNVYRYANIFVLERLYESAVATRPSGTVSDLERLYEQTVVVKRGYGYTSYEGLYEGFIAQKG